MEERTHTRARDKAEKKALALLPTSLVSQSKAKAQMAPQSFLHPALAAPRMDGDRYKRNKTDSLSHAFLLLLLLLM